MIPHRTSIALLLAGAISASSSAARAGDCGGAPVEEQLVTAQGHAAAHRWQESATVAATVAACAPDGDVGRRAAALYVESVQALIGTRRDREIPQVAALAPALAETVCGAGRDGAPCAPLRELGCDVLRLEAEQQVRDARSPDAFEAGAHAYLDLWERFGERPLRAGHAAFCPRLHEVLYNAARALQAARRLDESIGVRQVLLDRRNGMADTPVARRAVYEIGTLHLAQGRYVEALPWLLRHARENRDDQGIDGFHYALSVRFSVGPARERDALAAEFLARYAQHRTWGAALLTLGVVKDYAARGDLLRAPLLRDAMPLLPLGEQVEAHALLGRRLAGLRRGQEAEGEYRRALALFDDWQRHHPPPRPGECGQAWLFYHYPFETAAHSAVAEAHLFLFLRERAAVEAVPVPSYGGPAERDAIERWVKRTLAPWIAERVRWLEVLERRLLPIPALSPDLPPANAVAAAAHGALLWTDLVDGLHARTRGRSSALVANALAPVVDPIARRARRAAEQCVDASVRLQAVTPESARCLRWLERMFPERYRPPEELIPRLRLDDGSDLRPRVPLGPTGVPWAP